MEIIILDPSTRQRGTRRRVFSDGITKSSIWSGTVSENPSFENRFRIDVFPQLATLKQIHQMYHLPKIKSSYRASTSTEYSDRISNWIQKTGEFLDIYRKSVDGYETRRIDYNLAIDKHYRDREWSIVAVTKIAVLKGIHYFALIFDQFEA